MIETYQNKNLSLIDLDGFTAMKFDCEDRLWLEILEEFKYSVLTCFKDKEILFSKSLGDGLLVINSDSTTEEWLKVAYNISDNLKRWKDKYSKSLPYISYSIIFSKGDYFKVSENDVVGKDIDELFLIEHNGEVGEVLITQKMYNSLDIIHKKKFQEKHTKPITYLNNKVYKFFINNKGFL